MTLHIDTGFTSQAGRKPTNEDFCGALLPEAQHADKGAIMAIADGVSSGGMGKEAAQTTVISLLRDYYGTPAKWDTTVALDRIIAAQNAWLSGLNAKRRPSLGMTTLTALVLHGQQYSVAHVGDTRAYLLRGGVLMQLTQDHVVDHVDFKHQLLRAIGLEARVVVDYVQGELQVGDVFALLSDGVHGSLRKRQIQSLLDDTDSQTASQAIVDAALQAGSQDNASALVVRVKGLDGASMADLAQSSQQLTIPPLLKVGGSLDGLTVTALIADNGINVLYKVHDAKANQHNELKHYALKALHPARAHDADERAMLVHEAWLAQSITSEHLVQLVPTHNRSLFYLLYDWLEGESLEQLVTRTGSLDIPLAISIAQQALKALAQLHRQGKQCASHRRIT